MDNPLIAIMHRSASLQLKQNRLAFELTKANLIVLSRRLRQIELLSHID